MSNSTIMIRTDREGNKTKVCGNCKSDAIDECKSEITGLEVALCYGCGMRSVSSGQETGKDQLMLEVRASIKTQKSIFDRGAKHFSQFIDLVHDTLGGGRDVKHDDQDIILMTPGYDDPRFRAWAEEVLGFYNERVSKLDYAQRYDTSPERPVEEILADATFLCITGTFAAIEVYGDNNATGAAMRNVFPMADPSAFVANLLGSALGRVIGGDEEDPLADVPEIEDGDTVVVTSRKPQNG